MSGKKIAAVLLSAWLLAAGSSMAYAQMRPRQPRMWAAIKLLRQAKRQLGLAAHNKGGHRVAAIQHIDQAIRQVRQGIKYANHH